MNASAELDHPPQAYGSVARLLHWLVAGMIVLQYVLAKMAEAADEDGEKFRQLVLLANHKSVGISILTVAVLRLGWRLYQSPPAPLPMPAWQRMASAFSHGTFYALLFIMPMTGWLMSSAANISVSWFNLIALPDFIGPNEELENLFAGVHETFAKILFLLAVVHVAAALKHTFIDKDGILRRIVSPISLIVFVLIIIAGIMQLIPASRAQEVEPPMWVVDYESSHIRFTAEQAGATFDGEWQDWSAELRFASAMLEQAAFDVTVSVIGVSTLDEERDETMLDKEFFNAAAFPTVHYRATSFSAADDDTFVAAGNIEVKGSSSPVALTFSVSADGNRRILDGTARLDRLTLGIGTDEWEDTQWIGQYVDVTVHVEATLGE